MNIGIACHPTYGGSGIVATELGMELARRGHIVHLFSYSLPVRIPDGHDNVLFHRVEVSEYPLFRYPSYSLELAARIADVALNRGLDVLHAHYAIPHGMSALNARDIVADHGRRLPLVLTLHGTDVTLVGSQPSFFEVTRHVLRHADEVTAVSRFLAEETRTVFGVEKLPTVIPNFIDPDQYPHRPPKGWRERFAAPDEKILLHVSNFRPLKNIPHIIEAFDRIRRVIPSRLLLIGDGPERPAAEERCRKLGVCDGIQFMGMQSHVEDYYSVADLYLQASETESFGLSVLEAMAARVPVVAYGVGGLTETVADGETGFLVMKNDIDALAAAGIRILSDPARGRRMGAAGRRRALKCFGIDTAIPAYEEVYRQAIRRAAEKPVG